MRQICPLTRYVCSRINEDCTDSVCQLEEAAAILGAMSDVPSSRRMDIVAIAVDAFIRTGGKIGEGSPREGEQGRCGTCGGSGFQRDWIPELGRNLKAVCQACGGSGTRPPQGTT